MPQREERDVISERCVLELARQLIGRTTVKTKTTKKFWSECGGRAKTGELDWWQTCQAPIASINCGSVQFSYAETQSIQMKQKGDANSRENYVFRVKRELCTCSGCHEPRGT
jgi:hypothetical protein